MVTRITAVCGAAFVALALFRIWLTVRGRRFVRVGELADGTEVIVRRVDGVRELVLARGREELVQSRSDGGGYVREFHRAMRTTPRPRRVLFLGGGAGVGPMQFERRYADVAIDVVEKEPLVVEAAKRHFDFRETDRLKLHVADARDFLARASPYDLVILDLYDARGIPPEVSTREFFASIRQVLGPGGALVANLVRPPDEAVLDALRAAFAGAALDVQEVTEENALVFVTEPEN